MTGNKRSGFTLIELLVVAAIFSVAFLIATSVFVSVQRGQRAIANRQRIVADGRYVLEAMARTVRLGTVDFAYYRDPNADGSAADEVALINPQTVLAVRDQNGRQSCFQLSGTTLQTSSQLSADCQGGWTTITPSDVAVRKFQVYITPASDPFLGVRSSTLDCKSGTPTSSGTCLCNDAADTLDNDEDAVRCLAGQRCVAASGGPEICLNVNRQPTVTLVLETENVNVSAGERAAITLQTTVTSRSIKR